MLELLQHTTDQLVALGDARLAIEDRYTVLDDLPEIHEGPDLLRGKVGSGRIHSVSQGIELPALERSLIDAEGNPTISIRGTILSCAPEAAGDCQGGPGKLQRCHPLVYHHFEMASEMAWRACHEALLVDGYVNIDSPKAAMRQTCTTGLNYDEATWLSLLEANSASHHAYDDESAKHIFQGIKNDYLPLLEKLKESLNSH